MRTIIENVAYDTDRCELVAMRRIQSNRHEYLLRTARGVLLLAEAFAPTCLGRRPQCGDVVITASGRRGVVNASGDGGYIISGSKDNIPDAAVTPCHAQYTSVRLFRPGEPCDGFVIESGGVKERLEALGLIRDQDKQDKEAD